MIERDLSSAFVLVEHCVDQVKEGLAIRIGAKETASIMNYHAEEEECTITALDGANTRRLYSYGHNEDISDEEQRYDDMKVEHIKPPLWSGK